MTKKKAYYAKPTVITANEVVDEFLDMYESDYHNGNEEDDDDNYEEDLIDELNEIDDFTIFNDKYVDKSRRARPSVRPSPDQLRQFAITAMEEIEKNHLEDFVLLKNDSLREWWLDVKKVRAEKEAARKEKLRRDEVKKLAKERYDHMMSSFTAEEKKLLGL